MVWTINLLYQSNIRIYHEQYSQSIDSLSRKEIRRLILDQKDSKKARSLMQTHKATKGMSFLMYTLGIVSLSSGSAPSNSQEVNLAGIYGGIFIGAGLLFTIVSERTYSDAVRAYKKFSTSDQQSTQLYLRDSSLNYSLD